MSFFNHTLPITVSVDVIFQPPKKFFLTGLEANFFIALIRDPNFIYTQLS